MKRIAIHGVPRSGTTWVGALFDSCPTLRYVNQPLFSYAFKSRLSHASEKSDIKRFFEDIANSSDPFINQTVPKQNRAIPEFLKEELKAVCYKEARYHNLIPHLLRIDPELFMFLIIRNPLSVISSWVKAPREFDPERMDLMEEWRKAGIKNGGRPEEWYGFDKWKEFTQMALDMAALYPSRCKIIEYNELLRSTEEVITSCFAFCEIPVGPQTKAFIEESRSNDMRSDAYSVFRVKQHDDGWRGFLPSEIVTTVTRELENTALEHYLYRSG
ncbi:MAG: sulfotransferase [Flavobacteriales bacterium]